VSSSKDIAINYLRTWFFLDLVAALPFDLFDLISDLMVNIKLIVAGNFKILDIIE
jgi:hypothetical protein